MNQHVTIPTAFRECVDSESMRYALGAIQAFPAAERRVWIRATNSRMLAIREVAGHVDGPALIPSGVLFEHRHRRDDLEDCKSLILDDAGWRDSECYGKPVDGKFPRAEDVIPEITDKHVAVSIDAKMLYQLACALNDEFPFVTLYVGKRDEAIGVLGSGGFGVLMPRGHEDDVEWDNVDTQNLATFNEQRARHIDAAKSSEKPMTTRDLLAKHADLLSRNPEAAERFAAKHAGNAEFVELAEMAKRLKAALTEPQP